MALLQVDFFSEALQVCSSLTAIMPQKRTIERLPVLYLLHGMSDDHTIWQRRTSIERYVENRQLAVIMPNVHRSFYTDTQYGHRYYTFVSEELPRIAQSLFHLSEQRDDTFVAGLSMGGFGAFKLALTHPERFAAAASLSGALDMAGESSAQRMGEEYTRIFGDHELMRGSANDLLALAQRVASSANAQPNLYICCGTEDFLYEDNARFLQHSKDLGMAVTYEEGPGEHEWGYWDRMIQNVLAWLPLQH